MSSRLNLPPLVTSMKLLCVLAVFLLPAGPLSGAGGGASSPSSRSEISKRYFAAKRLFDKGQYCKARMAWHLLLVDERANLSDRQVRALEARIGQVDRLVEATTTRLPGQTYTDMAQEALTRGARLRADGAKGSRFEFDKAIMYLERAVEARETDPRIPYIMAYALLYTNRLDSALACAERAVATLKGAAKACNLAAEICRRSGQRDRYIEYLSKSLKAEPNQREVHYRLTRALISRDRPGDLDLALRHALASIGDDQDRARELAALFPTRRHREELESVALDIAIRKKRGARPSRWQRP